MKFSGSVGRFHGGAAGQGMGVQYCASLFSKLSAEGTLENPTTEWVPKVQSGVFPRQSLRQKYGDEIRPISVGRGFFSILFFRALSGDGAFLSPIFKERKECRTSSTS